MNNLDFGLIQAYCVHVRTSVLLDCFSLSHRNDSVNVLVVVVPGVDVIELAPSCNPLICLHSNIGQKQMDCFLQQLTPESCSEGGGKSGTDLLSTGSMAHDVRNDSMLVLP